MQHDVRLSPHVVAGVADDRLVVDVARRGLEPVQQRWIERFQGLRDDQGEDVLAVVQLPPDFGLDERPLSLYAANQSLVFQRSHRLADRGPSDTERADQKVLGRKFLSRFQSAHRDLIDQMLVQPLMFRLHGALMEIEMGQLGIDHGPAIRFQIRRLAAARRAARASSRQTLSADNIV
ncbi:MAG: hypothetical protein WCB27_11315 [Thermoguttaceae bacterium]